MHIKLKFPCVIKQVTDTSVTIEMDEENIALIHVINISKCFPWLSEEDQDELIAKAHSSLITDAIRAGITSQIIPRQ